MPDWDGGRGKRTEGAGEVIHIGNEGQSASSAHATFASAAQLVVAADHDQRQ